MAVVNLEQARAFGKATVRLTKTYAIDVRMLA